MTKSEKMQYLYDNHFGEWMRTRMRIENEQSDLQMYQCVCGRLATGMHESRCSRFRARVDSLTVTALAALLPRRSER